MFEQPPGAQPRPPQAPEFPDFVEQRGSWYHVTMPDGDVVKVQGRSNLDAILETR